MKAVILMQPTMEAVRKGSRQLEEELELARARRVWLTAHPAARQPLRPCRLLLVPPIHPSPPPS